MGTREGQNGACNDDLDVLIKEYSSSLYAADFIPNCSDFTATSHSLNFTFQELNTDEKNHIPTWAILRNTLLMGIEQIRAGYGGVALTIKSGYRSPSVNYNIEILNNVRPAPASRHVHGDAVDIKSNASTWQDLHNAAHNAGACVEPEKNSKSAHVHADWRPRALCKPLWQQ
jgi:uncharacterized protein YcbK (DUF882 family)